VDVDDTTEELVLYETPAPKVARLVLNRPDARNAQNTDLLYALNDAFDRAAHDDEISVIILAANGPHFSAGHDMLEKRMYHALDDRRLVGTWGGFHGAGAESTMAREKELYIGMCERWRNIPKPTIAAVHGKVIAGGLMLVWPCDLIVAAEDASFVDNTVSMGIGGVEYFGHPWELGVRQAKEMLFTGHSIDAARALALGMVNHVVPPDDLDRYTLELAEVIAEQPLFALKLAKESVNAAQDSQGRVNAMQTSFALHQLAHTHNLVVHGAIVDPTFMKKQFNRTVGNKPT
jgi:enoyl-CoA hydratase